MCPEIVDSDIADVIILGAGAAGISAALNIHLLSMKFDRIPKIMMLEGRDRTGGRAYTDPTHEIDMGASWIHGNLSNPLYSIAESLGITMKVSNYSSRALYSSAVIPQSKFVDPLNRFHHSLCNLLASQPDSKVDLVSESHFFDTWDTIEDQLLRRLWSKSSRENFPIYSSCTTLLDVVMNSIVDEDIVSCDWLESFSKAFESVLSGLLKDNSLNVFSADKIPSISVGSGSFSIFVPSSSLESLLPPSPNCATECFEPVLLYSAFSPENATHAQEFNSATLALCSEVEQEYATDALALSAMYYNEARYKGDDYILSGGYSTIMNSLLSRAVDAGTDIRLNHVVESIDYNESGVTVGGYIWNSSSNSESKFRIRSKAVICALPLGVLRGEVSKKESYSQLSTIIDAEFLSTCPFSVHQPTFSPPLPMGLETAISSISMGTLNKYIFSFPHESTCALARSKPSPVDGVHSDLQNKKELMECTCVPLPWSNTHEWLEYTTPQAYAVADVHIASQNPVEEASVSSSLGKRISLPYPVRLFPETVNFDYVLSDQNPRTIMMFSAGAATRLLGSLTDEAVKTLALDQLSKMFPQFRVASAPSVEDVHTPVFSANSSPHCYPHPNFLRTAWDTDPFSKGSYSSIPPGVDSRIRSWFATHVRAVPSLKESSGALEITPNLHSSNSQLKSVSCSILHPEDPGAIYAFSGIDEVRSSNFDSVEASSEEINRIRQAALLHEQDFDDVHYPSIWDGNEVSGCVCGTILFAGEHTHREHPSTVHGAYLSGLRAARDFVTLFTSCVSH